ncbi:MFS transporter [Jannaschia formosa]|uniref:MFS transporter n=1 Tax=Jannaschia formosa TaxID=2259592 RepID=UPI000E1BF347|nr:MFS transporter [Jannaschia formosa]TFL18998.1 MFS transporter [Jannaschia formosa]
MRLFPLSHARDLPFWRRPEALLMLMAFAMPVSFATWSALLDNYTVRVIGFEGSDTGLLHSVREIPGFLAVGVIAVIIFVREQVLALTSLILLGLATALTAQFPSMGGLLTITLLSSIGYHYYETVNQSLQLQWLPKDRAPKMLGVLLSIGAGGTLLAYGAIVLTWRAFDLSYDLVYWVAGGFTAVIAALALILYPQFESPHPQTKEFVLRRRYWLYYAMQFMSGARRQIFIVFAYFMMVQRFDLDPAEMTLLLMVTMLVNMLTAPLVGRAVAYFGERRALMVEYGGLFVVFVLYAALYVYDWGVEVACALFVANNVFFSLALAIKTYFQKIASPGDIAPTAAVAFTINHIAAVFLPVTLGLLWDVAPTAVFAAAAAMALASFGLSTLVPRHPSEGHETTLAPRLAAAE